MSPTPRPNPGEPLDREQFRREMAELGVRIDNLPYKLALANVPLLVMLAIITLVIARFA